MPTPNALLRRPARTCSVGPRPPERRRAFEWWAAGALAALGALAPGASAAADIQVEAAPASGVHAISAARAPHALLDRTFDERPAWLSITGQIDGHALLREWEAAGVSAPQAFELLSVLVLTQSPVIARADGAREAAAAASKATQDVFEIRSARNAEFFLRRHHADALAERAMISEVEALNRPESEGKTWKQVHDYWDVLTRGRADDRPVAFDARPSAGAWAAAQRKLAVAVETAGLASVRVPVGTWGNAAAVDRLAHRIEAANTELQALTGWKGPVLGLAGRVSITPFSPDGNGFAYRSAGGDLRLDAHWEDVPHEWIHVLDSTLRRAPANSDFGGCSLSQQVAAGSASGAVENAWRTNVRALDSSEWGQQRHIYIAQMERGAPDDAATATYLRAPSEMLAYAWGAYVQSKSTSASVFFDSARAHRKAYDGLRAPSLKQAGQQESQWNQLFAVIGTEWWSPAVFVSPTVSQWRAARARSVAEPIAVRAAMTP